MPEQPLLDPDKEMLEQHTREILANDPPPGLPAEFAEDWRFITDKDNWALGEETKARWQAALQQVAAQQNAIWELEETVSKTESERNERGRTIHALCELLREREEKCCVIIRWVTVMHGGDRPLECHEVKPEEKCDLCRRSRAARGG